MKHITVTFKSGRYAVFSLTTEKVIEIQNRMFKATGQIQLLIFDEIIINLYEVESITFNEKEEE